MPPEKRKNGQSEHLMVMVSILARDSEQIFETEGGNVTAAGCSDRK